MRPLTTRPNILLVSLDTTRADRLGCYGYARPTSPNLDALAAGGAVVEQFLSPHIPTYPGHTGMLTGLDIFGHGITCQSGSWEPYPGVAMLAELLEAHGYLCAAADTLGRWFTRGFQILPDCSWPPAGPDGLRRGGAVVRAAREGLASVGGRSPVFLFAHFWDAHTPYLPPPPYHRMFYTGDETLPGNRSMDAVWGFEPFRDYFAEWMGGVTDIEFPKAQYDASLRYQDACLGELLSAANQLLGDHTIIAVTADHGEDLDEHGCWFDHHGLYDTNLHVPLVISAPEQIRSGTRLAAPAATYDLVPTLLDLAGLPPAPVFGTSLAGALRGASEQASRQQTFVTENTWQKKHGLRTSDWKLILPLEPRDLAGPCGPELYALGPDPNELHNVATEYPDVLADLAARVTDHIGSRMTATGRAYQVPLQPVPLRHIGGRNPGAPVADATGTPEPDFVGYEAEPAQPA